MKTSTFEEPERPQNKLPCEMSVGNANRPSSFQPLPLPRAGTMSRSNAAPCQARARRLLPAAGRAGSALPGRNFPQELCPGGAVSRQRLRFSLSRAPFLSASPQPQTNLGLV